MYRTKVFNNLCTNYLKPIMDFVGISYADDPECGLLKIVGADKLENGKAVPTYFTNPYNDNKTYAIVRSQDEFINYRIRREKLEYFNPFVKYKNALTLLLMCTPVVYEMTVDVEDDDEDVIADLIVNDELNVTQDEIIKHVKIKQYPIEKNTDGESVYKYCILFTSYGENNWVQLKTESTNKIVSILMLIIRIMCYFDEPVQIVDSFGGNFDDVENDLKMLLEKYSKERELNRKDINKLKIDNDVEVFTSDEFDMFDENSVEDALLSDNSDEIKENTDKNGVIDVSNIYRDTIPIYDKMDDDDMVNIDYDM